MIAALAGLRSPPSRRDRRRRFGIAHLARSASTTGSVLPPGASSLTRPARPPIGRRTVAAGAACLLLAGLSLLVPSAPTTDPWGWIVWGREILHHDFSTVVPGAPSWKPLPVIVTVPLALAGGAAPTLWLLVARAGALASLVVAGRLAHRLAGRWAAVLAILGLVLSMHWLRAGAHGYTEPLAIALLLAAVDRHLSRRSRQALVLVAVVALSRPEAWLLVGLYGIWLWRRGELHPLLLASVMLAVPALWVVPDWIGSGDPFHAGAVSRQVLPNGPGATLTALGEAVLIVPLPLSFTAVAGTVIALRRGERTIPWLAALALAWATFLTLMMLGGYPVSSRFFILPAGLLCIVGAAGAVLVLTAYRGRDARTAVAVLLALAALPAAALRAAEVVTKGRETVTRAELESDLRTVVERARVQLRRCGRPTLPAGLGWNKGVVAWKLDLPFRRLRGFRTSNVDYIERLSEPGDEALPRLSSGTWVTVNARRYRRFVLLSPFGAARIRLAGRPRARLETVASAGAWRAQLLAGAHGCSGRGGS